MSSGCWRKHVDAVLDQEAESGRGAFKEASRTSKPFPLLHFSFSSTINDHPTVHNPQSRDSRSFLRYRLNSNRPRSLLLYITGALLSLFLVARKVADSLRELHSS